MSEDRAKREIERRRMAQESGLRLLMSDPDGRAFLWWLLELAGVHRLSASRADEHFDFLPYATLFAEGQRNLGNMVLSRVLDIDPGAYGRMMMENRIGKVEGGEGAAILRDED